MFTSGEPYVNDLTWHQAMRYKEVLNGTLNWRLPSLQEVEGILECKTSQKKAISLTNNQYPLCTDGKFSSINSYAFPPSSDDGVTAYSGPSFYTSTVSGDEFYSVYPDYNYKQVIPKDWDSYLIIFVKEQ